MLIKKNEFFFCFERTRVYMIKWTYQQQNYQATSRSAIIFTPTVSIKSAPGESGTVLFVLHEGTKVKLLDQSNDWINVALPNGNKGWVQETDLREI